MELASFTIDELVATDPALLADPDTIVDLHRQHARLEAVLARAASAFDTGHAWQPDRARTAATWLSVRCHLPKTVDTALIERVVFDSPSRVIDIGVARRLFSGATRRAIEVRDASATTPTATPPPPNARPTTSSPTKPTAPPPKPTAAWPAGSTTAAATHPEGPDPRGRGRRPGVVNRTSSGRRADSHAGHDDGSASGPRCRPTEDALDRDVLPPELLPAPAEVSVKPDQARDQ